MKEQQKKNREGLRTLIMSMTSVKHEVDVEGVPNYKYVCDKPESKFLTGQVEYSRSCKHLGSSLATECSMMKSSTRMKTPPLPISTLRSPCIHLTSFMWWMFLGLTHFSLLFYFCVLYWMQTQKQKWWRPGNEATIVQKLIYHSLNQSFNPYITV